MDVSLIKITFKEILAIISFFFISFAVDLSLYKDESQIEKKTPSAKRKSGERATPSSAKSAKKVNKRPNSNQEGKSKQATNSLAAGKKSAVSKTSPKKVRRNAKKIYSNKFLINDLYMFVEHSSKKYASKTSTRIKRQN